MLLKLTGSILTVFASTMIGNLYARKLSGRPAELRELQGMLRMFETQLCYLSSILADAFFEISKSSKSPVSAIFYDASRILKREKSITAAEAWKKSVEANINNTSLNSEDKNVLISFGSSLGNTDLEGQIKNIRFTVEQLKIQEGKAEEKRRKNEALYRNLGFFGGLAAVIISL